MVAFPNSQPVFAWVGVPVRSIQPLTHTCQPFRIKNQNPKCDSAKYCCPCRPRTNSYAPEQGKGVVPLMIGTFFIFTCKNSIFPALFEANITMPGADLPLSQFNIIFNYDKLSIMYFFWFDGDTTGLPENFKNVWRIYEQLGAVVKRSLVQVPVQSSFLCHF